MAKVEILGEKKLLITLDPDEIGADKITLENTKDGFVVTSEKPEIKVNDGKKEKIGFFDRPLL